MTTINQRQTQTSQILNHLKNIGPITAGEALSLYGIARLASRIDELKKIHPIVPEMVKVPNRDGKDVRIAKYSLVLPKDYSKVAEYRKIQAGYPESHSEYGKIGEQINAMGAKC